MTIALSYYPADLHLHTVLSPCAEIEMIPPLIVQRARRLGLRMLAVTDHNSAENAAAMMEAGARAGITVLPGMEVQTREEVHLLCLFDDLESALAWQEQVYQSLPPLKNRPEAFGDQLVVDAEGEFVAFNERLLLTSSALSVEQVFEATGELGGLVIPAHVDRPAFSLLANLGFAPAGLDLPAMEISARMPAGEARRRFPQLGDVALICSGDAHRLDEMRNSTLFKLARPTLSELRMAFLGREGRKVLLE